MSKGIRRLTDPSGQQTPDGTPTGQTVAQAIIADIRIGCPAEIAAGANGGIRSQQFQLWLAEGRVILNRLTTDPATTLTDEERIAAQFATDVGDAADTFIKNGNTLLESSARRQRITTTRTVTDQDGKVSTVVTVTEKPGDTGPLMWRMAVSRPELYGKRERIDIGGVAGSPVEVDLAGALDRAVAAVRANVTVAVPDPE